MFGFGSTQDLDDASLVVISVDQGGLALPGRDFYLKDTPSPWKFATNIRPTSRQDVRLAGETKDAAPETPKSF